MIIPSQHASRVARAAAGGGGGGDVTPNAVNWAAVYYDNESVAWGYSERQITGINQTITLQVQIANGDAATLYYFVSSNAGAKVSGDATSATSPSGFSMNSIANNGTFTVTNNQYVTFGVETGCNEDPVATVKNQSDSNATLDTFAMAHYGEC
jgi:hypothetical protein